MRTNRMEGIAVGDLKLAAEDLGWLVDRGYDSELASLFVAEHRRLSQHERRLLTASGRAQANYKHHIARELEPEDVARRPLRIDATSVLATVMAGTAGEMLLESLAGIHVVPSWQRPSLEAGDALTRAIQLLGDALKRVRPSAITWYLDRGTANADSMVAQLDAAYRPRKGKTTVELVDNAADVLCKKSSVASNDTAVLDHCVSWLNLSALALEATSVNTLRL